MRWVPSNPPDIGGECLPVMVTGSKSIHPRRPYDEGSQSQSHRPVRSVRHSKPYAWHTLRSRTCRSRKTPPKNDLPPADSIGKPRIGQAENISVRKTTTTILESCSIGLGAASRENPPCRVGESPTKTVRRPDATIADRSGRRGGCFLRGPPRRASGEVRPSRPRRRGYPSIPR